MGVFRWLLRLYPAHVRAIYGDEMTADFERQIGRTRPTRTATLRLLARALMTILPDAMSERIAALSSHPSFHGRRPSNLGVVRPPNVGKREWFYADDEFGDD